MNLSREEVERWHYQQKESFAYPRPDLQVRVKGKIFSRTLGKRCPWCKDIFYTYQVEGEERQPYQVDADIVLGGPLGMSISGIGTRETCGHPKCHEAEDKYQYERRIEWRKSHLHHAAEPAPSEKKKVRD